MAVGTVSGLNLDDEWQLIATNTPSGAASSTFSSISGYKTLVLVFNYTTSDAGSGYVSFNGDTTTGNYASNAPWYNNASNYARDVIVIGSYAYTSVARGGYIIVNNVNKSLPHIVEGTAYDASKITGIYLQPNPITSLTIASQVGGTISGTFNLYGIAA